MEFRIQNLIFRFFLQVLCISHTYLLFVVSFIAPSNWTYINNKYSHAKSHREYGENDPSFWFIYK